MFEKSILLILEIFSRLIGPSKGPKFFLKETDENAYVNCYYIDAVNYDHNGLMTLMTQSRGNILVFKKEESK